MTTEDQTQVLECVVDARCIRIARHACATEKEIKGKRSVLRGVLIKDGAACGCDNQMFVMASKLDAEKNPGTTIICPDAVAAIVGHTTPTKGYGNSTTIRTDGGKQTVLLSDGGVVMASMPDYAPYPDLAGLLPGTTAPLLRIRLRARSLVKLARIMKESGAAAVDISIVAKRDTARLDFVGGHYRVIGGIVIRPT